MFCVWKVDDILILFFFFLEKFEEERKFIMFVLEFLKVYEKDIKCNCFCFVNILVLLV